MAHKLVGSSPNHDELAARHGDVALCTERIDDDLYAVDVFPLYPTR